jgi:hypothetical protein
MWLEVIYPYQNGFGLRRIAFCGCWWRMNDVPVSAGHNGGADQPFWY